MNAQRKLKVVTATHRPVVDIYAAWRAEIAARDWDTLHTRADKREAVEIQETRRRGWIR